MKAKRNSSATVMSLESQNIFSNFAMFFTSTRVANFDFSAIKSKISDFFSSNGRNDGSNKIKKTIPVVILVIVLIVILVQVKNVVFNAMGKNSSSDNRVVISGPIATQQINKQLNIPIKDNTGKVATTVKYLLQSAELRNEIIVKGQKMVAVKGRTFLILNIKLTNNFNKEIDVNARDNVRIVVPGSSDKLAADIHNDPVAIQPISTKATRLGFPIDDNKKTLTLELGQLDGPKQTIKMNF